MIVGILGGLLYALYMWQQESVPPSADNEIIKQGESSQAQKVTDPMPQEVEEEINKENMYPRPPEIVNPTAFINVAEDIQLSALMAERKVILVKFWTFACVNCQHTLPHVNEWYERYKDQGFEIVSFHTPEFAYEHKLANVQSAVDKWHITYPVILDNDFSNFRAYNNRYWPHMYLIDRDGFIVYDHIGQGNYDEIEAKIKELLLEL